MFMFPWCCSALSVVSKTTAVLAGLRFNTLGGAGTEARRDSLLLKALFVSRDSKTVIPFRKIGYRLEGVPFDGFQLLKAGCATT